MRSIMGDTAGAAVISPKAEVTAVIIDNVLADPDAIRRQGLAASFYEDNRYFRGKRSREKFLDPALPAVFERHLGFPVVFDNNSANGVFQYCLGGDQLVYHSDAQEYAAVIYLTPDAPPSAGTTIYRSRQTKSRSPEEPVPGMTREEVAKAMYGGKLLDRTAWEVVDVFGNRYNRCVIWNARMVHAASEYFGDKPDNGRLFLMYFFNRKR